MIIDDCQTRKNTNNYMRKPSTNTTPQTMGEVRNNRITTLVRTAATVA